jgi:putative ABC transport system ATP-binding protein
VAHPAIEISGLAKRYGTGDAAVDALKGVDMVVQPGEVVGLIGPSGSGKSTLLKCLGAVIEPTSGRMALAGETIYDSGWKVADLRALRRDRIGFVFQSFHLVPSLTAVENVMLPLELAGRSDARGAALEVLGRVGLAERVGHYPRQLSGGEQQRVAIARAFVTRPDVLFADEPTGNLDAATGERIMDLLFGLNAETGTTLVLVTHDQSLAARCGRVIRLDAGRIVED